MTQSEPTSEWAQALYACARDTHGRLAPLWRLCLELDHPQMQQMALQLRNAAGHIDWAVGSFEKRQIEKAHDHVHRAALDACKVIWEAYSASAAFDQSLLSSDVQERYATLTLTAFSGDDGPEDVLDAWLAFLLDNGVDGVVAESLPDPQTRGVEITIDQLELERLATLASGWSRFRKADAELTAMTLRMSETLLPSYSDLWFLFCGEILRLPDSSLTTHLTKRSGGQTNLTFERGLQVALKDLEQSRSGWQYALVTVALDDAENFDVGQRAAINNRLDEGDPKEAFAAAYGQLQVFAPWYPLARRAWANARADMEFVTYRPTGSRMPASVDGGLIWFCDIYESTALPPGQSKQLLEGFLDAAAQCLLPARDDETLLASNTWGDQAMAAFTYKGDGMAALASFLNHYLPKLPPALKFRIGLATGTINRVKNPIVLYDVTGLPVIEAARLEPCARPDDSRYEVLCSRATAASLAHVPGWQHIDVTREATKSFVLEGKPVNDGDIIELIRLEPTAEPLHRFGFLSPTKHRR